MAISDNYSPDKNQGNGVTTEFSGSWKVLNSYYFRCSLESVSTGVQTLLTLGSDYDLEFGESGYKATLHTAPSSAYYVVRYRDVALDQTDPYRTSKGFQGTVIENSFDKLTAIEQDQNDQIERSIRCQVGDGSIGYIPSASARSLKYLAFDAIGNPVASEGTTTTPISSVMEPVVSASTLSSARSLFDVYSSSETDTLLLAKASLASPAFTGIPTSPTATIASNNGQIANTAYADRAGVGGTSQTWQNMTSSRAFGTTYTNSTGRPIMAVVTASNVAGGYFNAFVAGQQLDVQSPSGVGEQVSKSFIVPNGATYSISSNCTLILWTELR